MHYNNDTVRRGIPLIPSIPARIAVNTVWRSSSLPVGCRVAVVLAKRWNSFIVFLRIFTYVCVKLTPVCSKSTSIFLTFGQVEALGTMRCFRILRFRPLMVCICVVVVFTWFLYFSIPNQKTDLPTNPPHFKPLNEEFKVKRQAHVLSRSHPDVIRAEKDEFGKNPQPAVSPQEIDPDIVGVWPLPQRVFTTSRSSSVSLDSHVTFSSESRSQAVKVILEYYSDLLIKRRVQSRSDTACSSSVAISAVMVKVNSDDESLSLATDYSYILSVDVSRSKAVKIQAPSVYGVRYAMETLLQLIDGHCLRYSDIQIIDHPDYRHRGFMLDTGRRFVPKELLLNFLDAMSMVKLNVFHWHLSDWCLYSIESRQYPELNSCDDEARCYSVDEVKEIVAYAKTRGIRVIPEIDIPGHAKGLQQLVKYNMQFCDDTHKQIYNDPEGNTLRIVKTLIAELMDLFPDEYFHIGCDETSAVKMCNLNNIRELEEAVARFLASKGKIPIGWEEAVFTTKVKTENLVLQTWFSHTAVEAAKKGYAAIESNIGHFYLDYVERDLWTVWNGEIGPHNVNDPLRSLILGGEFAMWGDMWTKNRQCWDEPNWQWLPRSPVAHWMHDKQHDEVFMDSMAGLVWPRGIAAAGRFWKYSPKIDWYGLQEKVNHQNKLMISRGVRSCPVGCTCNYLQRCRQLYPK